MPKHYGKRRRAKADTKYQQKQPEEIKKEKEIRLKNLAKLEAYQKELKLKSWRQRASK